MKISRLFISITMALSITLSVTGSAFAHGYKNCYNMGPMEKVKFYQQLFLFTHSTAESIAARQAFV